MNTFHKRPIPPARGRQRVSVLEILDKWVGQDMPCSNAERIQRMRAAMFADVDALQKSGRIKLPK